MQIERVAESGDTVVIPSLVLCMILILLSAAGDAPQKALARRRRF